MLESIEKSRQQPKNRTTPEVRAKSAPQLGLDWDWAGTGTGTGTGTGAELSNKAVLESP